MIFKRNIYAKKETGRKEQVNYDNDKAERVLMMSFLFSCFLPGESLYLNTFCFSVKLSLNLARRQAMEMMSQENEGKVVGV